MFLVLGRGGIDKDTQILGAHGYPVEPVDKLQVQRLSKNVTSDRLLVSVSTHIQLQ